MLLTAPPKGRTIVVPASVPSVFQSSAFPMKNNSPFNSVNMGLLSHPSPTPIFTSCVPAGVPSVLYNDSPLPFGSSPRKQLYPSNGAMFGDVHGKYTS